MIGEVTSSPAAFDKLDIYQHHLTVPSTMTHHPWPDAYSVLAAHQCSIPAHAHLHQLPTPGLMSQNTYTCTVIDYKGK